MKVAYIVNISGRVTGVGFRYSAIHYAKNFLSLKGYVKNVGYAEVEALVQGEREEVDIMLEWLRHGPSVARVDTIHINKIPISSTLEYFRIK